MYSLNKSAGNSIVSIERARTEFKKEIPSLAYIPYAFGDQHIMKLLQRKPLEETQL